MSEIIQNILRNKKVIVSKLADYGFVPVGENYTIKKSIHDNDFEMTVQINPQGEVSAEVTDKASGEPYTLHLVKEAVGGFIGAVRSEYEAILEDIALRCFEPNVFKSRQVRAMIAYVRSTFGDELEFLWSRSPNNAIWRRKDNEKWYGAILTVSRNKLGGASDEPVEVIDLRGHPEQIKIMIDNRLYYPGYHMNKKHWYTIVLDGSVPDAELFERIGESRQLAAVSSPTSARLPSRRPS